MFDRRSFLGAGLAGVAATALFPRIAFAAAPTDRRFIFLIQRGAADGLHLAPPLGDPAYAGLRGALGETLAGAARIDSMFALHPALAQVAALHGTGQAVLVHAVASAYRERSHFDGQNVLETGGARAFVEKSGWMNRMLTLFPGADQRGMALAAGIPLAMRGDVPIATYAPTRLRTATDDLLMRVSGLYADDAQLAPLWKSAMATRGLVGDLDARTVRDGAAMGALAARLMTPADGARIMMIESGGWDTHADQAQRSKASLAALDAMVGALVQGLGADWKDTLVLVATEFGRTVAVNGTGGTDHGTGSAALLLGGQAGALLGQRRVIADWPGLAPGALFEGRDLMPTLALEALVTGAVAAHFAIDPMLVARTLYPGQPAIKPLIA